MDEQETTQQEVSSEKSTENVQATEEIKQEETKESVTLEELQQQNQELQLMVKQMQSLLNQQFQQQGNTNEPKESNEIEDYFNSDDSMVHRLLKANGYKESEINEL